MVSAVLIDGLLHGILVDDAAEIISVFVDYLLVKILSRFVIIFQAVDLRKLGIKFPLLQIEFLPLILVDSESHLLGYLHKMVLLGVVLDGVNVGLVRSLMITNFGFESLDGHVHFFMLGGRVSNKLVHFLSGCVPPFFVELIPVFIEGTRLEPLVVGL